MYGRLQDFLGHLPAASRRLPGARLRVLAVPEYLLDVVGLVTGPDPRLLRDLALHG